jgi:RHS repeat-associated protein
VLALTDSTGQIAEQYRYDAWGRTTVFDATGNPLSASALGNRYCWQGREYSWKTGLYYFRARWYDTITGRWLSNDPIGISGGLNQYVFCANNPVNSRDPFGLCETSDDSYSYDDFTRALWDGVDELGRSLRRPLDRLAGALRDYFRDDSGFREPPEISAYEPNTDLLLFVGGTKIGPKGWKPVKGAPFNPHGQPVFKKGSRYLTPDADSHKGGVWKMFDSKGRRLGTYDGTGTRIGR